MPDSYEAALERVAVHQQRAQALLDEAKALLRKIEWEGDSTHHVCPCCQRMRMHGHDADCALSRALQESGDE